MVTLTSSFIMQKFTIRLIIHSIFYNLYVLMNRVNFKIFKGIHSYAYNNFYNAIEGERNVQ